MEDIKGLSSLMSKLSSLREIDNTYAAVSRAGKKVQAYAKLLCPVNSGELRQSILESTRIEQGHITSTIYTNKEYAPYVEFGTGPAGEMDHKGISPKVNPTYTQHGWSYMDGGEWIYTNGQPAQPFMYPALKNNKEKIRDEISADIKAQIDRMV